MKLRDRIIVGSFFLILALLNFWALISVLIDQPKAIPLLNFLMSRGVNLTLLFLSCGVMSLLLMFYFFIKKDIFEKVPIGLIGIISILLFLKAIF